VNKASYAALDSFISSATHRRRYNANLEHLRNSGTVRWSMAPNAKGIFISYRREESAGHAGRIADNLIDHFGEDRIFQDIASIEPGEDFAEAIDRAVDSSGVLLAVIDRNWAGHKRLDDPDDYVRREIATALKRNVRVMPLCIQGAAMPRADELPDDLAPLARLNAIDLVESVWRVQITGLIVTLDEVLRREPVDSNREPEAEIERLSSQEAEIERLSSQIRMAISNRRITSREYKLMLNVDRFRDRRQASQEFLGLLDFLVGKEGGSIVEEQDEEEVRKISYLDTPEGALHQQGVALRLREEGDDTERFQVNLKYRDPDRYVSAAQDVSSPQADKTKFEEDILPPFTSRFSHSTSIESDTLPELGSMGKVMDLFPGLRVHDIDGDAAVKTVNDFEALEVVRKLCKLEFGEPPTIKASLSFWYLPEGQGVWPLVGEFSFDYDVLDSEAADENKLEIYPRQMVEGANRLFNALQKQVGWISFSTTTKTAFALEGL
jgi:hypothetical protein